MADIRSLLFPDSIAVVGASPRNLAAVGTVIASGVRAWAVNPNREPNGKEELEKHGR